MSLGHLVVPESKAVLKKNDRVNGETKKEPTWKSSEWPNLGQKEQQNKLIVVLDYNPRRKQISISLHSYKLLNK